MGDRAAGCLLGLALGDALGAPFQSRRAKDIPNPIPAFELPWMGLPPGTTTDAMAMALNLARSLAEQERFDPDDVVQRHLAWFRSDPPEVGSLTRRVLQRVAGGVPAEEAARRLWEERGPEVSAGNGSVMYCAPLGVAYAARPDLLLEAAPRLSTLTHHDERCKTAVVAVTQAIAALARGEPPAEALDRALSSTVERDGGEELEFLIGAAGRIRPVDGPDHGFCLFAAAVGLQALAGEEDFQRALRRVVSLGGDTDTNGAVAGALVGAVLGEAALPESWLRRLSGREEVDRVARRLAELPFASATTGGRETPPIRAVAKQGPEGIH